MMQALLKKELRESAGLIAVALLAAFYYLAELTGTPLLPWQSGQLITLPFVSDNLSSTLWLVGGGLAILLGLKQTAWEEGFGTYYFLLHRPVERWQVFTLKLATGITLVLGISGLLILAYALWAATPGNHDAPFLWSMTLGDWKIWLTLPLLYLSAFLCGIRPARWFGTKLLPLLGAAMVVLVITGNSWPGFGLGVGLLWLIACIVAIAHHIYQRDY